MRFECLVNPPQETFTSDEELEFRYWFPKSDSIKNIYNKYFDVKYISINKKKVWDYNNPEIYPSPEISEGQDSLKITYTIDEDMVGSVARVEYAISSIIRKWDLRSDVGVLVPTNGFKVFLDYSETEINNVYILNCSTSEKVSVMHDVNRKKLEVVINDILPPGRPLIICWNF